MSMRREIKKLREKLASIEIGKDSVLIMAYSSEDVDSELERFPDEKNTIVEILSISESNKNIIEKSNWKNLEEFRRICEKNKLDIIIMPAREYDDDYSDIIEDDYDCSEMIEDEMLKVTFQYNKRILQR